MLPDSLLDLFSVVRQKKKLPNKDKTVVTRGKRILYILKKCISFFYFPTGWHWHHVGRQIFGCCFLLLTRVAGKKHVSWFLVLIITYETKDSLKRYFKWFLKYWWYGLQLLPVSIKKSVFYCGKHRYRENPAGSCLSSQWSSCYSTFIQIKPFLLHITSLDL